MRGSGTITLFSERPLSSQRPTSFLISILLHGVAIGVIAAGIVLRPRFDDRVIAERYTVRHLDLRQPPPRMDQSAKDAELYPTRKKDEQEKPIHTAAAERPPAPRPRVARQVAQDTPTPQTLLQPKLPRKIVPDKLPVPTVVIWSMEKQPLNTIVPPLPHKTAPALVHPSVDPPNEEVILADLGIKSSELSTTPQPIVPSTTSPVVVLSPEAEPAPPETSSTSNQPPTPASIVSLSDLRANGEVVIPPANQTASSNSSGVVGAGRPDDLAKADANGTSDKPNPSDNPNSASNGTAASKATGSQQGINPTIVNGPTSVGSGSIASVDRIALPKDGQFGVVVVGSSLEERYPETAELWAGRLSYTVYLHVGLAKSWILQFALPHNSDAAAAGYATHLTAPWPYTIVRPNLAPGSFNADALFIHGVINAAGRFEAIAVAFPPKFPQAEFVLSALRQWQFRPATQGGLITPVEVLLIIPDEE
jgi:hypothetical protein